MTTNAPGLSLYFAAAGTGAASDHADSRQSDCPAHAIDRPASSLVRWHQSLVAACMLATVGLCLPMHATATIIGVSPTGSVKTVSQALQRAVAGDIIQIAAGKFPETLTTSKRVVFTASGGVAYVGPGAAEPPRLLVTIAPPASVTTGINNSFYGVVTLNGSRVEPSSVLWETVGAPPGVAILRPTSLDTIVQFASDGLYTLRLTATVNGTSASADLSVRASSGFPGGGGNQPFTVTAKADYSTLIGSCNCTRTPAFLATAHLDALVTGEGANPTYQWQHVGGPAGTILLSPASKTSTVQITVPGCHRFRVTVTNKSKGETLSSEVSVFVRPELASSFLKIESGSKSCGQVSALPKNLRNSHSCATISYRVQITWIGGQVPTLQTTTMTGVLKPLEVQQLRCGDADIKILEARYVDGCGAGDLVACEPQAAAIEIPEPRIFMLRADNGMPAVVLEPSPTRTNIIEVSSNGRDWSELMRLIGGRLPLLVPDPAASREPMRLYRVKSE